MTVKLCHDYFLSEMTEQEEVCLEKAPLGDCSILSLINPTCIGSESVSIQEHINVLEAHSLSYRSCASQLLCAILFGHICSQSIECEQTMIGFC